MVNVNIEVSRAVPQLNEDALTLVIFKNARAKTGVVTPVRINSLDDLTDNFEIPTGASELLEFRELYCAEYLIRTGVNLLCYPVITPGELVAADITAISDIEILRYKFIVAPYLFLTATNYSTATVGIDLLVKFVQQSSVAAELYVDLDPFTVASTVSADVIADFALDTSAKFESFINSGFATFASKFDSPTGISLTTENIVTPGTYAEATDFVGIPSSLAAISRKAVVVLAGSPWLPVAGETYGVINEFTSLFRALSTVEKEAFQAANINVLITRVGIGNLFVSQNTMFDADGDVANPLLRSHVVTEALWVKSKLTDIAYSSMFRPNNQKTWDSISLKLKAFFDNLVKKEGIESYKVYIGKNITMTTEDIAAGILKVSVMYLPIRVIEAITFNITIVESEAAYDITLNGGAL
jgi:hypothetical protein